MLKHLGSAKLFAVCLCFVALAGCGHDGASMRTGEGSKTEPEPNAKSEPDAKPIKLQLDVDVEENDNGSARISGTTNLPRGTGLRGSMSAQPEALSKGYSSNMRVADGEFRSDWMGDSRDGVVDAVYKVRISLLHDSQQPPQVLNTIGKNGGNLAGSLTEEGLTGGRDIAYTKTYKTGTEASRQAYIQSVFSEALEIKKEIRKLVENGRAMQQVRSSDRLSDVEDCGNRMRTNQAHADEVRRQAESLPSSFGQLVNAAAVVRFCKSCSPDAESSCERAEKMMSRVEIPENH